MNNEQTTRLYLYGGLRKECDNLPYVDMVAGTLQLAVQALASRFGEGVKTYIENNNWNIYTKKYSGKAGNDLGVEDISKQLGVEALHFYPVIEGSGKAGKIIAGIVLVIIGVVYGFYTGEWANAANIILAGVGMIMQGLATPKDQKQADRPDERASFVYNSAVNSIEQGGPVPLIYGRTRCGSTVVSTGIDAEQMTIYTSPTGGNIAPDSDFWNRDVQ